MVQGVQENNRTALGLLTSRRLNQTLIPRPVLTITLRDPIDRAWSEFKHIQKHDAWQGQGKYKDQDWETIAGLINEPANGLWNRQTRMLAGVGGWDNMVDWTSLYSSPQALLNAAKKNLEFVCLFVWLVGWLVCLVGVWLFDWLACLWSYF